MGSPHRKVFPSEDPRGAAAPPNDAAGRYGTLLKGQFCLSVVGFAGSGARSGPPALASCFASVGGGCSFAFVREGTSGGGASFPRGGGRAGASAGLSGVACGHGGV